MQFEIVSIGGPPPIWEQILWMALYLGPLVWCLLRWLRRSPRDAQDVLGSALIPSVSTFSRLLDFSGWLLRATLLLLLPTGVTAVTLVSMFFKLAEPLQSLREWSVGPSSAWVAAAVLVCSGCFIQLLRPSPSERDVLRAGART